MGLNMALSQELSRLMKTDLTSLAKKMVESETQSKFLLDEPQALVVVMQGRLNQLILKR